MLENAELVASCKDPLVNIDMEVYYLNTYYGVDGLFPVLTRYVFQDGKCVGWYRP